MGISPSRSPCQTFQSAPASQEASPLTFDHPFDQYLAPCRVLGHFCDFSVPGLHPQVPRPQTACPPGMASILALSTLALQYCSCPYLPEGSRVQGAEWGLQPQKGPLVSRPLLPIPVPSSTPFPLKPVWFGIPGRGDEVESGDALGLATPTPKLWTSGRSLS